MYNSAALAGQVFATNETKRMAKSSRFTGAPLSKMFRGYYSMIDVNPLFRRAGAHSLSDVRKDTLVVWCGRNSGA